VNQNPLSMDNKIVVITGASRGIGKAIALGLRDAGAYVIGTGSKPESVEWMQEEHGIEGHAIDVRDREAMNNLFNGVVRKRKKVDCLINNAGIADHTMASWLDDERMTEVMDINLISVMRCCQAYHKTHRKLGGNIINMSSIMGVVGGDVSSIYSASKAAVSMLTKSLAIEWAPYKFRVNALCPGLIDTDMLTDLKNNKTIFENEINKIPMKRMAKPQELVGAATFLASDASSFMTGQNLIIDGGVTAG
jgi:3-oxoacyl-[acyl-carrier protein] reductase